MYTLHDLLFIRTCTTHRLYLPMNRDEPPLGMVYIHHIRACVFSYYYYFRKIVRLLW